MQYALAVFGAVLFPVIGAWLIYAIWFGDLSSLDKMLVSGCIIFAVLKWWAKDVLTLLKGMEEG